MQTGGTRGCQAGSLSTGASPSMLSSEASSFAQGTQRIPAALPGHHRPTHRTLAIEGLAAKGRPTTTPPSSTPRSPVVESETSAAGTSGAGPSSTSDGPRSLLRGRSRSRSGGQESELPLAIGIAPRRSLDLRSRSPQGGPLRAHRAHRRRTTSGKRLPERGALNVGSREKAAVVPLSTPATQGSESIAVPSVSKAFPFVPVGHLPDNGLHKPVGLVLASAYILGTACVLSGSPATPAALTGVAVGSLYAALNRFGMKRFWRAPQAPLNVVVTGGAKGIGKALAREFLLAGDRVMITARTTSGVRRALADLREEVGDDCWVAGIDCEVSIPASVERLADAAQSQMGTIDVWVNNAGYSGSFKSFIDSTPEQIQAVVNTNLMGSLLCTRAALRRMAGQKRGGHIFNMDGAGADGLPTPQYAAYGATKAGIAHLMGSLVAEAGAQRLPVSIHTLSPGMVLTDLLLEGATDTNKQIFNILCEHPETVAAFLVPRARTVAARGESGRYIRYLTVPRALLRFITAPLRSNKYFDTQGEPKYEKERERIMGQRAKRTARLAQAAARRNRALAVAYSLSIAASYLIIVADSMHSSL